MASFEIEAMVRGYHIYKDVWSAVIEEEFPCKREEGNRYDPFAVAVCNGDIVIGTRSKKDFIRLFAVGQHYRHGVRWEWQSPSRKQGGNLP